MAEAKKNFEQLHLELETILTKIRNKETSLEASLDLFDEAISLGNQAIDVVDSHEFSRSEFDLLNQKQIEISSDEENPAVEPHFSSASGGADASRPHTQGELHAQDEARSSNGSNISDKPQPSHEAQKDEL